MGYFMHDLVIKNASLLIANKDMVQRNAFIAVDEGKITFLGKAPDFKEKGDIEIDASGKIVMPGLINSHCHMYGVLSHGMPIENAPSSFIGFIEDFWWPFVEDRLTKELIYAASKMSCVEMIKTGTTCVADILEAPNAIPGALAVEEKVTREIGIRSTLSFEASERKSIENSELGIKENLEFVKAHKSQEDLVRGMFCVHTSFTCSKEMLLKVRKLANEFGGGIHLHLEEGAYETMHSIVHRRKLPVEFYDEIGFLGPDVLVSQCVHTTPREIEILKRHDAKISHMPLSNCEVGGGIAPVTSFLNAGLNVGLGTDGYINDMFEVMRAAFLIHKGNLQDASVMPADVVFDMATRKNARSIGLERLVGELAVNKKADIIILDNAFPTPVNEKNALAQIVTFGDGSMVNSVIIDGKLVMKDRKILTVDEEDCREKCKSAAEELWRGIA
jgi:cytosine/adenosine deaminase-related metal-dependent hydrolase